MRGHWRQGISSALMAAFMVAGLMPAPAHGKNKPNYKAIAREMCAKGEPGPEPEPSEKPISEAARPRTVTFVDEILGGRFVASHFEKEYSTGENSRLNRLGAAIVPFSDRPRLGYSFRSVKMPDVINAFSLPGGHIYVSEKMLAPGFLTDEELAHVLGHEIAHAALRHVPARMTREAIADYVKTQLCAGADNPEVLVTAVEVLRVQMRIQSQAAELSADQYGALYALRAGYKLQAALTLMAKLDAVDGDDDTYGNAPGALPTHPPFPERIDEIKKGGAQLRGVADRFGEGRLALEEQRFDDAIAVYEAVLAVFPSSLNARLNYGSALHRKYRMAAGLESPSAGLMIAEGIEPRWFKVLRVRGASTEPDPAWLSQAVELYGDVLAVDEANPLARNNLGVAFLDDKRLDEAIRELDEASESVPLHPLTLKNLGLACYRKSQQTTDKVAAQGLTWKAVKALREYVKHEQEAGEIRELLARLEESLQAAL